MEVAYFDESNVALSSPLPNPLVGGTQNIRVEVRNPLNLTCLAIQTVSLIVNPNPLIELTGDELICTDDLRFSRTIDAGLLDISLQNQYTYTWFLDNILLTGETEYTLKVTAEGVYEVLVENQLGCTTSRKIEVTASNAATIENIIVTDFSSNNSIEIIVSGLGEYVFSINDGTYQTSNIFSQLESAIYTISVKDLKGCATVFETVYVLDVPKFFTPNGDGYNEFWNIKFLNPNLNLKVNIFDRYGKLLKRFDPKDSGWDGTYKGQAQPSTDYWFLVEFENGRNLRGHFSLKR
jgi:gliding motility-associated-like protein